MTEFDRKLVEKASRLRRFDYRDVDVMVGLAETQEGIKALLEIRDVLYDLALAVL